MRILSKQHIQKLVDYDELTQALVQSLADLETGKITMPPRMHAQFGQNTLLLMPCSDAEFFCTKLVSVFPENTKKELPSIYGTVVLNDGETGKPLAVLEGSLLTGLRTGAVGRIGIRYSTPKTATSIGLVGTGAQGYFQLLFACRERALKKIHLYNPDVKTANAFRQRLLQALPDIDISISGSTQELVEQSSIIITATNSRTPVLPDQEELYTNKHIIAVGSYTPDMQEIPDAVFKQAKQIIVDSVHASHESGDVINPLKMGFIKADQVIPISKIITEKASINTKATTIFKSVGMALFDLAAAKYVYQKAIENNIGTEHDF